jgi:hypothetical protein
MITGTTVIMITATATGSIGFRRIRSVLNFLLLSLLWATITGDVALAQEKQPTWVPTPEERADQPWIAGPEEALIGPKGISMSLGKILLARKDSEYCALKFTNTWLGETKYDHYTSYEFYYQGDGSGDFSRSDVESGTGELFFPRVRGWMGIPVIKGARDIIKCGGMKFKWFYIASVGFGGAELAPTPWTSINEVNVHDPRIKWYQSDRNRSRKGIKVHIDRLWDSQGAGEGQP